MTDSVSEILDKIVEDAFTENSNNLLDPPIPVKRYDLNFRWYAPTLGWWQENMDKTAKEVPVEAFRPSTTTICDAVSKGIGFNMWLGNSVSYDAAMGYANERADIGTMVHDACEQLIVGNRVDTEISWIDRKTSAMREWTDEHRKYIMSFLAFYDLTDFKTEATELSLYHPKHPTAGTIDWIVKVKNKDGKWERWMIDFKTGKSYDIHQVQLNDYKTLWDLHFPRKKIKRTACLYLTSSWRIHATSKKSLKEYEYDPALVEMVYKLWAHFNHHPQPSFKEDLPTIFTLNGEENHD